MKKYKKGFTLAEVLICLLIVGFIIALSIHTIRIVKASYSALTYFEFNTIKQIAGELIAGKAPNDNANNSVQTTVFRSDIMQYVITDDNKLFCEAIYKLVNSSGSINCTNFAAVGSDPTIHDPIIQIPAAGITPNIQLSNGHQYYISQHVAAGNISEKYGYRIISVDLNGTRTPNYSYQAGNNIPDIVSFVILDNGEVFPVGIAANNIKIGDEGRAIIYLNAKVNGYYFSDIKRDSDVAKASVPPECTLKTKDGNKQLCNYAVVGIPKGEQANGLAVYSYREAYCTALGKNKKSSYKDYCDGLNLGNSNCPPSTSSKKFDLCTAETVKPMCRYNFN